MAFKQLGAITITNASSESTVYTVPVSSETIVSSILINNKTASDTTIRLSHVPSGGSIGNAYYIIYNEVITAGGRMDVQLGVTMATGDVISAYSTINASPYVNVIVWGDEQAT